ncbi:MAG: hypothetical protein HQ565_10185 [Bacteroidetes bacterium]|nr:hypothetical protein [Bacteroidota bacterium]
MKYFTIAICLILLSCNKDHLIDTIAFNNYIKSEFNFELQVEKHCYILIPEYGCQGCMQDVLDKISKLINVENKSQYTFIASNEEVIPASLKSVVYIYYDRNNSLDKVSYDIANVTVVKSENKKIVYVQNINLDQSDNVESIIRF